MSLEKIKMANEAWTYAYGRRKTLIIEYLYDQKKLSIGSSEKLPTHSNIKKPEFGQIHLDSKNQRYYFFLGYLFREENNFQDWLDITVEFKCAVEMKKSKSREHIKPYIKSIVSAALDGPEHK